MTLMAKYIIAGALAILVLFGASWCWERSRGTTTAQQEAAHAGTVAAEVVAAKAETVYVDAKASAVSARTIYRTSRDTVLLHLTDTVLVKQVLAHADTVIAKDSTALAKADTALRLQRAVTDSVRRELAIALRPHYAPRLSGSAAGLYEPLDQVPSAALAGNLRVISGASLTVQYHQRFTPGEKPRFALGVALAF